VAIVFRLLKAKLVRLRNEDLDAAAFLELVDQYGLGEGETECLAHALASGDLIVCTDDRKARGIITALLGRPRLTGTIGLLLRCFRSGALKAEEIRRSHEMMVASGAFLPSIRDEDLSAVTVDANSDSNATG
jgi:predicted nucleic acid-binding protein